MTGVATFTYKAETDDFRSDDGSVRLVQDPCSPWAVVHNGKKVFKAVTYEAVRDWASQNIASLTKTDGQNGQDLPKQ